VEGLGEELRTVKANIKKIRYELTEVQEPLKPFEDEEKRVAEANTLEDEPKKTKLLLKIEGLHEESSVLSQGYPLLRPPTFLCLSVT
jgi:hypothetical protein